MARRSDQSTWDIVAMVDEPAELVLPWVAWHLAQGARRLWLLFDRTDDPVAEMVSSTPRVTVTCSDAAFWNKIGQPRPERHQQRQVLHATWVAGRTPADWLVHCDADEFLVGPLGEELARQPAKVATLRIPVRERMFGAVPPDTIFQGAFRSGAGLDEAEGVARFGPDYRLTDGGLTGHAVGKSATRLGRQAEIRIHLPRFPRGSGVRTAWGDLTTLVHYDGLTPFHWELKLLRKAHAVAYHGGPGLTGTRGAQVRAFLEAGGDAGAALSLHDRLKRPTPEHREMLRRDGLLDDSDFNPAEALERWFPEVDLDLSPEAFDAALRRRQAQLVQRYGL